VGDAAVGDGDDDGALDRRAAQNRRQTAAARAVEWRKPAISTIRSDDRRCMADERK
jgi:hypothetical protein